MRTLPPDPMLTCTSTASGVPEIDIMEMLAKIKEIKANRPKVDCFLMMAGTAHALFQAICCGPGLSVVVDHGHCTVAGLPLWIAHSRDEYRGLLADLRYNKQLRVGVMIEDRPESGIPKRWKWHL